MKEEILIELKEQKSILSQLDKQYFVAKDSVPAHYFENMEDEFFSKIKAERADNKPGETKSISMWRSAVTYKVAAVSAFAILGFGMFNLFQRDETRHLSQNEVISYLEEENELTDESIEKMSSEVDLKNLSNSDVEQYLMEHEDIDINTI